MKFSFQLYSARNFQPWSEVLSSLSDLGYRQVEGFGGVYENPASIKAMMDDNNLSMPSGHFDIAALENDFAKVDEIAGIFGISKIVCPFLQPGSRPETADGWRDLARRLSAVSDTVSTSGRSFAWHNHDFEFEATPDGHIPMQVLLDDAPTIEWEADLAWIVRGGSDPFAWIEKYGDRISAVHVKDIAVEGDCMDEDGWADVGQGTMQWHRLFDAVRNRSRCELFVAEHDNPNDLNRFAGRSIEAMRSFWELANV
ncbi:MAG: sugar phosphate isomerase/epimerase family protein [Rhizobiaceae bacterium]